MAGNSICLSEKTRNLTEVTMVVNARNKMAVLFDAPSPEAATKALPALELHAIIRELGAESAFELFQMATPEQARVILDLELWEDWSISVEETARWLDLILSAGDEYALRLLPQLDQEIL